MTKVSRSLVLQIVGKVERSLRVPPRGFLACSSQFDCEIRLYHPLEIRETRFDTIQRGVLNGVEYGLRQ
jgi:hypothetical protein